MSARRKTERSDPGRGMRLMWDLRIHARRGPKPSHDVVDVVSHAIELADKEGLTAVSMRRLAERLDVGTMSVYTYVPSKHELFDLMVDRVMGETEVTYPRKAGWRAKLEAHARAGWEIRLRHPWLQQMPRSRPLLGPNGLDRYEQSVAALAGVGLTGSEIDLVVTLVSAYVEGAARYQPVAASPETGVGDAEWWGSVNPVIEEVWDAERFPTLSGADMEGGWLRTGQRDAAAAFDFGLARVLDGVEAFTRGRT
jgi:AcrR family transcriptional regulator